MAVSASEIYDEVLEAMPIDPEGILAFKLPRKLQQRVSKLAARLLEDATPLLPIGGGL